jgi:2-(3-amino-3-carboxypropyl)histidine synthase
MKKKDPTSVPTIYVPCRSGKDIYPAVKKAAAKMGGYERIGLISTAQHLHLLPRAAAILSEEKKKPVVGGQILGCNVANAERIKDKVDAFLYIGSGMFHPAAFLRAIDRPFYVANPYTDEVAEYSDAEKGRWEKKQKARITRCVVAQIFGILVSTKTGQFNYAMGQKIKRKLEKRGRKAYIFAGAELSPDRLLGYRVDAWVNTACPRIVDDYYDKPVINPEELEILLELIK